VRPTTTLLKSGIGELLHRWQDAEPEDRQYDVIVATRDHHIDPGSHFSDNPDFVESWPPHCVVGTDGAAFHPNLDPQPFHAVFLKGEHQAAYSGFEGKSADEARAEVLDPRLAEIQHEFERQVREVRAKR